jgi:hypothetical protein
MILRTPVPLPPAENRAGPAHPPSAPWGQAAGVKAYGVVCFFDVAFGIGSAPAVEAAGASWKAFVKTRATIVLSVRKPRPFYAKAA